MMPQSPVSPLIGLKTGESSKVAVLHLFGFKVCTTRTSSFQFTPWQTIRIKNKLHNIYTINKLYLHTRYYLQNIYTLSPAQVLLDRRLQVHHQARRGVNISIRQRLNTGLSWAKSSLLWSFAPSRYIYNSCWGVPPNCWSIVNAL